MNRATILGRIGKELELRYTPNGTAVTTFSLATSKKVKGEQVTQWHNLVAFGKTAEILSQYVSKGDQLLVEGEIQYRSYDNKDGQKVHVTEILVNQFHFVGNSGGGQAPKATTETPEQMAERVFAEDEEIPF